MEIFIKHGRPKTDPKHPESHFDYLPAARAGQIKMKRGDLKFETPGAQADYERAVKSNPNNVMGFPIFYPRQVLKMFKDFIPYEDEVKVYLERVRQLETVTIHIFCRICGKVTPHGSSPETCFCKACGTQKPEFTRRRAA